MINKKAGTKSLIGSSCVLTTMLLLGSTFFSQLANAVPSFARQTDVPCAGCHFQNFPALNTFGRHFRANGYTLTGSQKKIEGDNISLPATLNASIITKLRYQQQGSDDRGEVQWPDEAALLVGGRLSEDTGFLMELGMGPQEAEVAVDTGDGSLTCTNPADATTCTVNTGTGEGGGDVTGNFLSTKLHFNVMDSLAIIPFSTDGLGVGYGFELLNTGVQRSQRPIENRKGFGAAQMLGTASGEATGIAVVYHTDDLFVNYSHWAPTWGNVDADPLGGLAHYLRAAYMPSMGGWDMGVGFSMMSGTIDVGANDPAAEVMVDSWGVDAQAQGTVGEMPLGIYLSYGAAPKSTAGSAANTYNASTLDDATALGFLLKLGVIPGKTQIYLGYGSHDFDEDPAGVAKMISVNEATIGVQHMVDQNIKIELFNVSSDAEDGAGADDKSKDYTMLMLFAGF
ncbi:MAG: hypothetical protein OEY06_02035 [Gammaproteobacteria bacterium]|nr:hypothetical protein [Gammaproteobacteria bacterium]